MAALTSRITLRTRAALSGREEGPEDYLSTALGVIFPDDVTNQHGDAEHELEYRSPVLGGVLRFEVGDPEGEGERRLFSHFLWNASLLLAELVERDSTGTATTASESPESPESSPPSLGEGMSFDVRGLRTLELGAGTALPSVMAGLLGAKAVRVTDYPADSVLRTLRGNVMRNLNLGCGGGGAVAEDEAEMHSQTHSETQTQTQSQCESKLKSKSQDEHEHEHEHEPVLHARRDPALTVSVDGHAWGEFANGPLCATHQHAFDVVMAADCLWMPWQHENLRRSIGHFLSLGEGARAWVVAGFHTGRAKMAGFFDADALRESAGLEVERIWEVDCDGVEREWRREREEDDASMRKRWLVVAVLRRVRGVVRNEE